MAWTPPVQNRPRITREEIPFEEVEEDEPSPLWPTFVLGGLGFMSFGGAVTAFLRSGGRSGGGQGLENPVLLAWAMAIVGAGLVGLAVYFLLKRLSGGED